MRWGEEPHTRYRPLSCTQERDRVRFLSSGVLGPFSPPRRSRRWAPRPPPPSFGEGVRTYELYQVCKRSAASSLHPSPKEGGRIGRPPRAEQSGGVKPSRAIPY